MSVAQLPRFFPVVVVFLVCDFKSKRLANFKKTRGVPSREVYFCGRSDRLLRIALTHCQHAAVAEAEIHQAPAGGLVAWQRNGIRVCGRKPSEKAANVALRLLEAKVRGAELGRSLNGKNLVMLVIPCRFRVDFEIVRR